MGAGASRANVDTSTPGETTILAPQNELPVSVRPHDQRARAHAAQFAPSLLSSLADSSSDSATAGRQSNLDAHIRSRIASELDKLKADEESVQRELAAALKRENAEREGEKPSLSSPALQEQLESVRRKIERNRQRRDGIEQRIAPARDAVVACYRQNPTRTLDCWREVDEFTKAVAGLQQEFAAAR